MDFDETLSRFVDDATLGLKDDAELRLDVRAELRSHLEESIAANEADGKTREESLELAQRAFGPVAEVASDLVEANQRRMKLRALARLAVRRLLVPASVLMAFIVLSRMVPLRGAIGLFEALAGNDHHRQERALDWTLRDLTADERFLFQGDRTRATEAQQQRAIWESRPDRAVYYANYIGHLLTDPKARGDLDFFEEEVRRGMELDPHNGRYSVLLAGLWAQSACDLEWDTGNTREATEDGLGELVITDRDLLDRAMAELLAGLEKPTYSTHTKDMLRERLAVFSPAKCFEQWMSATAWAMATLLPHLSMHRDLARKTVCYGELLIKEGNVEGGERILDVWYPLAVKASEDAFTLIEMLVACAVVRIGKQYGAAAYERLGRHTKAAVIRRRAERLLEPFEGYINRRQSAASDRFQSRLLHSGGIFDRRFVPALPPEVLPEVDLGAGRWLEHVLVEQTAVTCYVMVLAALMLFSLRATIHWRRRSAGAMAPLLLLPPWRAMLRIQVMGVLLPLLVFYFYTRYCGFAGRGFGFTYRWPRFVGELLLLGTAILLLTRRMAARAIRQRCQELDIPVPPDARSSVIWWPAIMLAWAWPAVMLAGTVCLSLKEDVASDAAWTASPTLWGTAVISLLVASLAGAIGWLVSARSHGLYHGTIARSQIPIFAAVILVISVVALPYLRWTESRLLQSQTTASLGADAIALTQAAAIAVRRLRTGVLRAAAELEQEAKKDITTTHPHASTNNRAPVPLVQREPRSADSPPR